jgi:hypothetical protein
VQWWLRGATARALRSRDTKRILMSSRGSWIDESALIKNFNPLLVQKPVIPVSKTNRHLHAPAFLESSFWYPNHVGSFRVNHKRFGNPNGSYDSLRWTNHSSSIDTILVTPKSRKCLINEFWRRNVIVWTIITLMPLWPTSVENMGFDLACWGLALVSDHLLLLGLVTYRSLFVLDMLRGHYYCQNRSDRFPNWSDRFGAESTPITCGHASMKCPCFLHL